MTNALCTSCGVKHRMYEAMLNGKCSPNSYKTYRNKLTTTIRAAKAAYFNNYINNHRLNARAIWNMINAHICHSNHTSSNKTPLHAINLNRLIDFFANLGINTTKHLPKNNNYLDKRTNPSLQSMYLIPVSEEEVIKIFAALPAKESALIIFH